MVFGRGHAGSRDFFSLHVCYEAKVSSRTKSRTANELDDFPAKPPETRVSGGNSRAIALVARARSLRTFANALVARARALRTFAAAALGTLVTTPWTWMVVTCLMLGISGGVRYWRGMEFYDLSEESRASPFPLAELPKVLGAWRIDERTPIELDPEIARIAGSSDHIVRIYTNVNTGESASVLLLYGLASTVCFHTPEACYPAAGYTPAGNPPMADHELKIPGIDKLAVYRQGFFSRSLAGRSEYSEVVYSFRHAGDWLPNARNRWKAFRYRPGMFKVQIARTVNDLNVENSSSVELLREFMLEIETRLAAKASAGAAAQGRKAEPGKVAN